MPGSPERLKQAIVRLALAAGYDACATIPAAPFPEYEAALAARARRFPEAAEHYRRMQHRVDPRRTAPWARSIVVCLRRYGDYRLPPELLGHFGRNYLADRRTRACPEYPMARTVTEGLRALGLRVKKGGVPDRAAAAKSGLVRILRSGFAWTPEAGTWLNIETWRVSAELPPDTAADVECPCPPGCRACFEACPTGALAAPFTLRLDHCIAYLTYDAPFPPAPELWAAMGPWVYGCDRCQEVCPLNRGRLQGIRPAAWLDKVRSFLTPAALARMDAQTYASVVHPLFWYIPLRDLDRWRANARRALDYENNRAAAPHASEGAGSGTERGGATAFPASR